MNKKQAFFFRQYTNFQGGHLKVFDYFRHMLNSEYCEPRIYFTPDSVRDENNPWIDYRKYLLNEWNPHKADLLLMQA